MKRYWLMRTVGAKTVYRQLVSTLSLAFGESLFVNGEEFVVTG